MPRSKTTRKTAPKTSVSVLDEETKKKCHSIIEDFDRQVLSRVQLARSNMEKVYSQIRNKSHLLSLKVSKDMKSMALSSFEALLNSPPPDEAAPDAKESLPPPATSTIRKSRRTKKSTLNKENSSTVTRKSTRSTAATPLTTTRSSKRAVAPTPMTIKTKFNIGTPLTKSICRLAKPNEPLVSMSGSPVMLGSTGGGGLIDVMKDLDEISKDKLLSIQSRINHALEQKK